MRRSSMPATRSQSRAVSVIACTRSH